MSESAASDSLIAAFDDVVVGATPHLDLEPVDTEAGEYMARELERTLKRPLERKLEQLSKLNSKLDFSSSPDTQEAADRSGAQTHGTVSDAANE